MGMFIKYHNILISGLEQTRKSFKHLESRGFPGYVRPEGCSRGTLAAPEIQNPVIPWHLKLT
jgi:hypothetical protein